MTTQMWDPVSKLLTEFRDDVAVAAIVGANPTPPAGAPPRVRGQEPEPGDAQGAGKYRAFILISTLGGPPHPSVPIQRVRHNVSCYGRDKLEAAALYAAAHAVVHHKGPRQTGNGNAIYVSHDDTGGSYGVDPDTKQPLYSFVIESLATTQAVAP